MSKRIPIEVKRTCCEMFEAGIPYRKIYEDYYLSAVSNNSSFKTFRESCRNWRRKTWADDFTLASGTYPGFTAHSATVQVSKTGEITQAWIKQTANEFDPDDFIRAIRDGVEPYAYQPRIDAEAGRNMLEIPLFDMHWGVNFLSDYLPVLDEVLELICSKEWEAIVIPFGQDFFHNDSIVNGQTTKGTNIEKVDMIRAVKEGRTFMHAIIDAAIEHAGKVRVLYTPGNHDMSTSWMFMQALLERYGSDAVDDSFEYRKSFTYGANAIMVTHGNSKQATAKNLAQIFPIAFPTEFAGATVREIHAGHLHREGDGEYYGVRVRRLSTGSKDDGWADSEDFIGAHKRFMLFEWSPTKLKSIHYV